MTKQNAFNYWYQCKGEGLEKHDTKNEQNNKGTAKEQKNVYNRTFFA